MRLAAEIAVARAVGALSRRLGRGGGTTLPGKLLLRLDEGAVAALASRLPEGAAIVSATNGKTTTAALAAGILREGRALAHNGSGANLLSGVASCLLAAPGATMALLEVDEAALPEVARRIVPRVLEVLCQVSGDPPDELAAALPSTGLIRPSAAAYPHRASSHWRTRTGPMAGGRSREPNRATREGGASRRPLSLRPAVPAA